MKNMKDGIFTFLFYTTLFIIVAIMSDVELWRGCLMYFFGLIFIIAPIYILIKTIDKI